MEKERESKLKVLQLTMDKLEKTYGKGSVQSIIPLSDGGGLRLTVSKYYLPSGKSISGEGVTPDIVIEEESDLFRINTETDNQLDFAVKLLNG